MASEDFEDTGGMKKLMELVKSIFDEALLAGFTQGESMHLASTTLQGIVGQALADGSKNKVG